MALRRDLPAHMLQRAVEIMRQPKSLTETAKELKVGYQLLLLNMTRAGLYQEFKGRKLQTGPKPKKEWSEGIANARLQMKLRRSHE